MPFFTKYNVYSFISNFMWNFFLTLPTIQRMNKWIFLCLAGISIQTQAQQSNFLQEYRAKVKEYNQDIKAAGYAVSIQKENEKSAKALCPVMPISTIPAIRQSFPLIFLRLMNR